MRKQGRSSSPPPRTRAPPRRCAGRRWPRRRGRQGAISLPFPKHTISSDDRLFGPAASREAAWIRTGRGSPPRRLSGGRSREEGGRTESVLLREPHHQVEALDRGAGRPLHEVVDGGYDNHPAVLRIGTEGDVAIVASRYVLRGGEDPGRTHPHEGLFAVTFRVRRLHRLRGD